MKFRKSTALMMAFSTVGFMACSQGESGEQMGDNLEDSTSLAHGNTSDDLAAGRGDTTLNNGSMNGGQQGAMNGGTSAMLNNGQPMTDGQIFAVMSMMDSKEVNEGRIGTKKAQNADVKKYAQMLVEHHTKMMKDGQQLMKQQNVAADSTIVRPLLAGVQDATQRLNNATGANFDAEFVALQVTNHEMALNHLNQMMNQTQNQQIKAHIQKGIPIIQSHLDQARQLQTRIGATAGTTGGTAGTTGGTAGTTGGTGMGTTGGTSTATGTGTGTTPR